jgi:hypothetical protein
VAEVPFVSVDISANTLETLNQLRKLRNRLQHFHLDVRMIEVKSP